jgi:hypothetical protein
MRFPVRISAFAFGALLLGSSAPNLSAVILDWGSQTWVNNPDGSPAANAYDIDGTNPGDDVTVVLGGTTEELANDSVGNLPTPNINSNLEGGLTPFQDSLNIAIDLGKKDRFVTITITFSASYTQGVENVSFSLFGIDQATGGSNLYIDEISSISALSIDGVTQIAPTITNVGSAVSHTGGTGLNQLLTGTANVADTGAGSGNGNATVSFNAMGIRSITFTFGASGNSAVNPTFQDISMHDLTFSPVPEVNPTIAGVCVCLFGVVAGSVRRLGFWRPRAK